MTEHLHFCEHGRKYAIPLNIIRSTLKVVTIDEEAGGVINFHGKQIPVLALDLDFKETREIQASDSLIITAFKDGEIALCADAIEGITAVKTILPGDLTGTSIAEDGTIIIDDLSLVPLSRSIQPPKDREAQAILERRARSITLPDNTDEQITYPEILRFSLGYIEYAVEMQYVREVILTGEITPVPGIPAFITGISVVRGRIISLVDLRKFFGIPEMGLTDFNRVIILSDGRMTFGLLVDRIRGRAHLKKPFAPARVETKIPESHLIGIVGDLIIIDGKALLTDESMLVNEQDTTANIQIKTVPE